MRYNICIGTHHKTGTVWMDPVFRLLAKKIGVPFVHLPGMNLREQPQELKRIAAAQGPCIFFDTHSRFPDSFLQGIEFRGLHLLRHPKDVAISCARYHQFSEEKWLHRPWQEYQGRTYQEVINSLPTFWDRVAFELNNIAGA
ncbi:MAG: hypothetical protein ACOC0S_00825 [Desulfohalobiaceae bacterium]